MQYTLDPTDYKILNILQQDGRMDVSKISLLVHKSETPVRQRIKRLRESGFIERFTAVLNRRMLGRPTLMVTLVKMKSHEAAVLREFADSMGRMNEVQLCLHLSGEFDFLLQVSLCDPQSYGQFLMERLLIIPSVDKVQSSLVLTEYKMMAGLPLME